MRQNRLSQRLKSKLDSFGFDALIKGVSTLVEESPELKQPDTEPDSRPAPGPVETAAVSAPSLAETESAPAELEPTRAEPAGLVLTSPVPAEATRRPFYEMATVVETAPAESLTPQTTLLTAVEPDSPVSELLDSQEPPERPEPAAEPAATPARVVAPEPLREALLALSCRLTQEAGRMAAALQQHQPEEAGFFLAHVNQILELLHTLDGKGDMARQLGVPNGPPPGRTWPLTAWTVVEFAESPFSSLLPSDAGEAFVRDVIYAAWGISFDSN